MIPLDTMPLQQKSLDAYPNSLFTARLLPDSLREALIERLSKHLLVMLKDGTEGAM